MLKDDGSALLCVRSSTEADCRRALDWLADVATLGDDLFIGEQHVADLLPPPRAPEQAPAPSTERLAGAPSGSAHDAAP